MTKSTILVGLLLLLSSVVPAQSKKVFEGSIAFNFKLEGGGAEMEVAQAFMPTGYIFKIKGESLRMTMQGGMSAMASDLVVNAKTKEQYMLMEATMSAMRIPVDDEASAQSEQASFTVSEGGDTRKIQGYLCQHYIVHLKDQPGTTIEMWLTEEIKLKIPRKSNSSPLSQVGKYGLSGFPLRMVIDQAGMLVSMEAVEIKVEKLADSLFEVPGGYTITEYSPDAMDEGAGHD